MEIIKKIWDYQNNSNNLYLLAMIPFNLYGGIYYYQHIIPEENTTNKVLHILFFMGLIFLIIFRPYIFSYKTNNILTDIKHLDINSYEINTQIESSTTLIFGCKLFKFNCSPSSKATYIVRDKTFENYKKGDALILLLGADNQIKQVL